MSLGWASVSFGVFDNSKSESTLLGASEFLTEVVFSVVVSSVGSSFMGGFGLVTPVVSLLSLFK